MNNLAPRQGLFAIILLVSFCLHLLMLMFSTEKQQYDYRTDKGEKIVEQLSKEAMVSLANQDRISLSVLANRYQVDNDVAKLVITDQNKQALVQTGQSQTEAGQVIDQPIIQDNQVLGHAVITMKATSKGEIVADQWLFILGSAILHGFLWLIYGYLARPTAEQLALIGEKVQQRMALARSNVPVRPVGVPDTDGLTSAEAINDTELATSDVTETNTDSNTDASLADKASLSQSIHDFLHQAPAAEPTTVSPASNSSDMPSVAPAALNTVTADSVAERPDPFAPAPNRQTDLELQIRFFDEFELFHRVAPEISKPYLLLCEQLLARAQASLFDTSYNNVLRRYIRDVTVTEMSHFSSQGAVVHLSGKPEQVALASVLLAKLVIILNQVVYEKHRELSRFALPLTVGTGVDQQFDDVHRLMVNHGKEDGLLLLLPPPLLKTLHGHVQLKGITQPTTVKEREMVWYNGLSEIFMTELIKKRDEILTSNDKGGAGYSVEHGF